MVSTDTHNEAKTLTRELSNCETHKLSAKGTSKNCKSTLSRRLEALTGKCHSKCERHMDKCERKSEDIEPHLQSSELKIPTTKCGNKCEKYNSMRGYFYPYFLAIFGELKIASLI